jgi:hypothetical protein
MDFISDMIRNMTGFISVIVALPFLIIALIFLFLWIRARRQVGGARNWPSTTGRVISSEMEARRSHSSEGGYSTSYYAVVLYEYMVDGKRYQSNRLTLGTPIGTSFTGRVQKKLQEYPVGNRVQVFYDPDDPTEAVLEVKAPVGNVYLFVSILIFVILAVTMAFTLGGVGFASQIVDQLTSNIPR